MTIHLIAPMERRPGAGKSKFGTRFFRVPPLGLLNVAAVTPRDITVRVVDENVQTIDFGDRPDLAGVSVTTASADKAYAIADRYRAQGVPVVLGGTHASTMLEEAARHADAVVVGEAEGPWERLLEDFRRGGRAALKSRYRAETFPDLARVPFPDLESVRRSGRYTISNLINTTRGCPHNCSFCSVTELLGRKMRCRPVQAVAAEIRRALEAAGRPRLRDRFFVFVDDNIMANKRYARELFKALIPYRILWISQTSVNSAYDDELLELAARSGCKGVFIGLETVSECSLAEIGKRQNDIAYYGTAVEKFHSKGIFVEGAFIFGFDSDGPEIFQKTVEFVKSTRIDGVQYTILTPLPGTDFYRKIEAEGRFIDRNWVHYDCTHPVFAPKRMSARQLEQGLHWAYRETYSLKGILSRIVPSLKEPRRKYFPLLLAFNLRYRKVMRYMFATAANPAQEAEQATLKGVARARRAPRSADSPGAVA